MNQNPSDKKPEPDQQTPKGDPPNNEPTRQTERRGEPPAMNSGETLGSSKSDVIGRDGETIVNDRITDGRPLDGEEPDDVDRRAP